MPAYELAQLNIAVMKEPLESPRMTDFVANLEIMRRRKEWFARTREAWVVRRAKAPGAPELGFLLVCSADFHMAAGCAKA